MTRGREIKSQTRVRLVGVCAQLPLRGRPERGALLGVAAAALEGEADGAGRDPGCERVDTIVAGEYCKIDDAIC